MELKLRNVTKTYERNTALNAFDYTFTEGLYGLLGPNGAGKSTLMNLITQNMEADSGEILLNGHRISEYGAGYRKLLGYMPQQQTLYDEFTGEDFLRYMAALKGMTKKKTEEQIGELLEVVNLKKERKSRIKTYSGGMKQRIMIAQALLNDPAILLMDEPTVGLDPQERIRVRNFISTLAKNRIIILATHIVTDVESIANNVIIMKKGEIICSGATAVLLKKIEGKVFDVYVNEQERMYYLKAGSKITNVLQTSDGYCIRMISENRPEHGEVRNAKPGLEDLYLYWQKREVGLCDPGNCVADDRRGNKCIAVKRVRGVK